MRGDILFTGVSDAIYHFLFLFNKKKVGNLTNMAVFLRGRESFLSLPRDDANDSGLNRP